MNGHIQITKKKPLIYAHTHTNNINLEFCFLHSILKRPKCLALHRNCYYYL